MSLGSWTLPHALSYSYHSNMGESWKHKDVEHSNAPFFCAWSCLLSMFWYGGTPKITLELRFVYRKDKQNKNKRTLYKGYFTFQGILFSFIKIIAVLIYLFV